VKGRGIPANYAHRVTYPDPVTKYRLCNYAPHDAAELDGRVVTELAAVKDNQRFLRNLYHASELPLPRTLLS